MADRVAAVVERCGVVALGWRPVHAGHSRHCRRTAIEAGQGGGHKRASGPCALRAGPKVPGSARLARRILTSGPDPEQILATGFGGRQHVILPVGDVARIPGAGPGGAGGREAEVEVVCRDR